MQSPSSSKKERLTLLKESPLEHGHQALVQ